MKIDNDRNDDDESSHGKTVELTRVQLSELSLPKLTQSSMDFLDSTFFRKYKQLPTPEEVMQLSPDFDDYICPPPVQFVELGLHVKFGKRVLVEEAQNLWAVRHLLQADISVPEVYGWRVHQGRTFIYMELVQGDTLKDRWDALCDEEISAICGQLRDFTTSLRLLEQNKSNGFVGSINNGALQDIVFEDQSPRGPFTSVCEFNDWLSQLPQKFLPETERFRDPYRDFLPDDVPITFTHGDLHRNNIIISRDDPPRVISIIDWAHAGWYPAYWEYCKALYTSHFEDLWRLKWISEFLEPYDDEFEAMIYYAVAIGAI